jgi:hypothetical protein
MHPSEVAIALAEIRRGELLEDASRARSASAGPRKRRLSVAARLFRRHLAPAPPTCDVVVPMRDRTIALEAAGVERCGDKCCSGSDAADACA